MKHRRKAPRKTRRLPLGYSGPGRLKREADEGAPEKPTPARRRKKRRKPWIIESFSARGAILNRPLVPWIWGRYATRRQAETALAALRRKEISLAAQYSNWTPRTYRIREE